MEIYMNRLSSSERKLHFETLAVHGGFRRRGEPRPAATPIYQTSTFYFDSAEQGARLFKGEEQGDIYTRISNPTHAVFEERMALLEGGEAALATASGMSAISLAVLHFAQSGDEIVSVTCLYGGTFSLFRKELPKLGIKTRFVDPEAVDSWEKEINDKTKLLYVETPGNPTMKIVDLEKVGKLAAKYSIPAIVDNTFASPYLQNPIQFGCEVVVHSATKYICGHGTSVGGVIVGKRPLIDDIRATLYRDLGASASPFNTFLFSQGLETLAIRMERHSENATRLAEYLNTHPKVKTVHFPGLPEHPGHQTAKKQMKMYGGMLNFILKGEKGATERFLDSLQVCVQMVSLGDNKTLVTQPFATTHQYLDGEDIQLQGIGPNLIRVSVGIEHIDDIIADFDQALAKA